GWGGGWRSGRGKLGRARGHLAFCRGRRGAGPARGVRARGPPGLPRLCRARIAADGTLAARIAERRAATARRHDELWAKWQDDARKDWDAAPVTLPRFALEIWDVIKGEDWVLSANSLRNMVRRLWDFDRPYRHPGR